MQYATLRRRPRRQAVNDSDGQGRARRRRRTGVATAVMPSRLFRETQNRPPTWPGSPRLHSLAACREIIMLRFKPRPAPSKWPLVSRSLVSPSLLHLFLHLKRVCSLILVDPFFLFPSHIFRFDTSRDSLGHSPFTTINSTISTIFVIHQLEQHPRRNLQQETP